MIGYAFVQDKLVTPWYAALEPGQTATAEADYKPHSWAAGALCVDPYEALQSAVRGDRLAVVRVTAGAVLQGVRVDGTEWQCLLNVDASPLLLEYIRRLYHRFFATDRSLPQVVQRYLATGDPTLYEEAKACTSKTLKEEHRLVGWGLPPLPGLRGALSHVQIGLVVLQGRLGHPEASDKALFLEICRDYYPLGTVAGDPVESTPPKEP